MNNDIQPIIKKVANNILEFLIDPTVYPPERHIYFRPEEILENSFYENAKKDSKKEYGDQRLNSDFYPNRPIREASMERKTLIASLDVLSQEFNESDPIAKDLRTMAFAVAKMSGEELKGRLSGDKEAGNPWMDHMKKVRKDNPGKSVKELANLAKKTYEPVKAEEAPVEKEAGKKKGPGIPDGTGPMKDSPECPKSEKSEKEAVEIKDFWNKEATEAVRKSLIAEASDACDDKKKKEKKEEKEAATSPAEEDEDTKKEVEAKKKKEPEKKELEEVEVKEEVVAPENGDSEKEVKEEDEKEATEVDTGLLNASSEFEGIELQAGLITTEDLPDLSATEKERLGQLFK